MRLIKYILYAFLASSVVAYPISTYGCKGWWPTDQCEIRGYVWEVYLFYIVFVFLIALIIAAMIYTLMTLKSDDQ